MKSKILLLQTVVYGDTLQDPGWIFPTLSDSISSDSNTDRWIDTLFSSSFQTESKFGTMTDEAPIDFVAENKQGALLIEPFSLSNKCLFLLTRM